MGSYSSLAPRRLSLQVCKMMMNLCYNWKHMLEREASDLYDACLYYQLTYVNGICNIAKNNKHQRLRFFPLQSPDSLLTVYSVTTPL